MSGASSNLVESLLEMHDEIPSDTREAMTPSHEAFDNFVLCNIHVLSNPAVYRQLGDLWTLGRLAYMPWHLFSDVTRTLVISYNFAPYTDASAVTVAKRLRDFGEPVHVLSQDMKKIRTTDQQLARLVEPYAVQISRVCAEPTFADWRLIKEYVAQAMSILEPELASGQYLKMYSRSMFPASHVLAAHIKSLYPDIVWIAEFSDPLQHTVEGTLRSGGTISLDAWSKKLLSNCPQELQQKMMASRTVFAWCEYLPYSLADRLWFTNDFQREVMLRDLPSKGMLNLVWNRSEIHPHPTYPPEFYHIVDPEIRPNPKVIRLGYFGEFYSNRGLDDIFRAAVLLPSSIRNQLEISVYTGNTSACVKAAASYGVSSVVSVRKAMPLLDFFAVSSQMDVLVVNDVIPGGVYGCNPYLPSKVSDYKGSGTEILALVWPGSTLSKDPDVTKFSLGDTLGISRYLSRLVDRVKAGDSSDKP